ncbi:hypothetical protein LUZ60_001274 [Juncus effusus]|nr:hypothetical protein LUZ60_001274 [Juncus effusus]
MVQKRGGGPAPFLMKTHQMVEEPATDDVISWGENGRSFVVRKPVEFARDLLPVHFKHNNFSSFVRQLNTYGFRKVVPDKWEFSNENFRKNEPNLLSKIRRRKTSVLTSVKKPSNTTTTSHVAPPPSATTSSTTSSPLSPSPPHQNLNLLALINENEQLKKDNLSLTCELSFVKRRCNEMLGFLSKFVDVKEFDFRILMQGDEDSNRDVCKRDEIEMKEEEECGFKLFGVRLKEKGGRKRGVDENSEIYRVENKNLKIGFGSPWPVQQSSGKVCN